MQPYALAGWGPGGGGGAVEGGGGGGGAQAGLHYTISGTPLASATRGDQGAKALRTPL